MLVFAYAVINCAIFVLILPNVWPRVFSDDDAVVSLASRAFKVLFVYGIADAIFAVTSGVLRGAHPDRGRIIVFGIDCSLVILIQEPGARRTWQSATFPRASVWAAPFWTSLPSTST